MGYKKQRRRPGPGGNGSSSSSSFQQRGNNGGNGGNGGRFGGSGAGGSGADRRDGKAAKQDRDADDYELDYLESKLDRLVKMAQADDRMDARFGFTKFTSGPTRLGWLLNMQSTVFRDSEGHVRSAVDFYFMEEDGGRFKVAYPYLPYFFIKVKSNTAIEVEQYLRRKFDAKLASLDRIDKEDLSLPNHLVGLRQLYLKLSFLNVHDLMHVKSKLMPRIRKNQQQAKESRYSSAALDTAAIARTRRHGHDSDDDDDDGGAQTDTNARVHSDDVLDNIVDIREYDVPYHMRVSIDNKIACGKWYDAAITGNQVLITERADKLLRPDPIVLAWDIETTKLPLKFPDMETDQIMMISYMIDGQGYLIINREIVSEDIEDFEYTPKPEFPGPFTVMNEQDEHATISRFFQHIRDVRPHIMATYNGDFFDWPFLERRAEILGMNMFQEIGYRPDNQGEYKARFAPHMDCFRWVKRDSYLPVGSQGLKAVTRAKLRYDPLEIHYEEICRMAAEEPQQLANYSVSDAVATYYLYMKYVNPFIFALCTIIPLGPDDVLRKGSGTLCESLLMFNAYHANIIMPNKKQAELNKLHGGRLLDSETYIGGHVEALESGVFRSDIPCRFRIVPSAVQTLIDNLDNTLRYAIEVEEKRDFSTITNYEEVKAEIVRRLEDLRDNPYRQEVPLIYHLDVAAMYPNIILTNRLQPPAMVDEAMCAACSFNKPGANCQRKMPWKWRGEVSPASRNEYESIKAQLESEVFPGENEGDPPRPFHDLTPDDQAALIKKRLHAYARRVYKKTHITTVEDRTATVCQRENPFYINTVRNFRDRRYVFKGKLKEAKKTFEKVQETGDPVKIKETSNLVVLYDSLQLAHKCILNSFYGYVMRKGARWYSMEMAGIVCLTGANIITRAREIVEQLGRPLELDTDGIWCCLPGSFPEKVVFKTSEPGKKSECEVSYPGAMLNIMVKEHFTNDQYQDLVDAEKLEYETKVVNSIFFEVDGPYKAMILPASKEKDKKLKKRYAVFDDDGNLCELKGFEIKRNGELKLIKIFQSSVFEAFLQGDNLEEVYEAVATVADHWLDILYSKGEGLSSQELFDLISENRSMSRTLKEYEGQKSTSISTAKRLAEFLGPDMVKDKGLACQFVISKKPEGAPVTERAIPVAIFQADESVRRHYLRKWTKEGNRLISFDIRDILDWDYYIERLGSAIQKIITIPAALQKVPNPVPRVPHPDWLQSRLLEKADTMKQQRLTDIFQARAKPADTAAPPASSSPQIADMEDQFSGRSSSSSGGGGGGSSMPRKQATITIHRRVKGKDGRNKVMSEEVTTQHWREALGPPPNPKDDFGAWLRYQKKKWRIQRTQRNLRKQMGVSADTVRAFGASSQTPENHHSSGGGSVGGGMRMGKRLLNMAQFLRQKQGNLNSTHWEIIQIAETREPGIMKVWCMVAGDLHCMRMNVPRRFYVNLRTPDTSGTRERVNKILPRHHKCYHLYEFRMREREFLQRQRVLAAKLSHPDIIGVYELNIPLLWQAVVQLGCVATLRKTRAQAHKPGEDFDMDDLQSKTVTSCPYLHEPLNHVFLFHSYTGTRAVFALFVRHLGRATVVVVDPGNNKDAIPNLRKMWRECAAEQTRDIAQHREGWTEEELRSFVPQDSVSFDVQVVTSNARAYSALSEALEDYREGRHGPTTVIAQSPLRLDTLRADIPALEEYPVVTAPSPSGVNQYAALNWQKQALHDMLAHCCMFPRWFAITLKVARYAHVPIGNLPADHHLFICDVFYARQLRKQNFLLWASPSHRPDLGGKEEDDNRLMSDDSETHWEINNPGVYSTACVDITLSSLPMAAVLYADDIHETENGASMIATFDSNPKSSLEEMVQEKTGFELTVFDESAQCMPAFKVLRLMLNTWLKEVIRFGNTHADEQLVHFFRWLKSPDSLLYDPAMLRLVRGLMKKLFLRLISELRKLGSQIVFANFARLLIKTDKTNVEDATAYTNFILKVIREQEVFRIVYLQPTMVWDYLVWMDVNNYGGIDEESTPFHTDSQRIVGKTSPKKAIKDKDHPAKRHKRRERMGSGSDDEEESSQSVHGDLSLFEDGEHARDNEEDGGEDESDMSLSQLQPGQPMPHVNVETHWNIAAFLPKMCQEVFEEIVGRWILLCYNAKVEARRRRGGMGLTPLKEQTTEEIALAKKQAYQQIKETLSEMLMKAVAFVNQNLPGDARAQGQSADFPMLPGSHLPLKHPALELTKSICHVLMLDKSHASDMARLKRNLLQLISVREFSSEAKFKDPCLSFVLSDFVCTFCNTYRDLDLCRDSTLSTNDDGTTVWKCHECDSEYDRGVIEQQLIEHINQIIMMYQLQDVRCIKCKQVKDTNMHKFCECSGTFNTASTAPGELKQQLSTMQRIAQGHKLELLEEMTTWALGLIPN